MGKMPTGMKAGRLSGGGFANRTSVLPGAKLPAAGPSGKAAPTAHVTNGLTAGVYRGKPGGMC